MAGEGSELERGLCVIVDSFYRYAEGPPGAKALDQAAFQSLLSNELSHQLTVRPGYRHPKATGPSQLCQWLDANKDQKISFDEYWQLIAWICQVIRRQGESHMS
uniref:Protein S100 n=1 Tax=Chelydra serpentina TaxID=8475 RepID=A0A8C3SEG8_CHESE